MRQISIVIKASNPAAYQYSTLLHLYEIGLYLLDSGLDVIHWASEEELHLNWDYKYMTRLPVVIDEADIPNNYILITDALFYIEDIDKLTKIILLNSPTLQQTVFKSMLYNQLKNKLRILYCTLLDSAFLNTDIGYELWENNKTIEYQYGLYPKYLLHKYATNNKWFLYDGCKIANDRIKSFIEMNHIEYDSVSTNIEIHNMYDGVMYANRDEFFIRFPFEFSLANKKVVMFECGNAFRNLTTHLLWNYPYTINDIPMLNLDLNLLRK